MSKRQRRASTVDESSKRIDNTPAPKRIDAPSKPEFFWNVEARAIGQLAHEVIPFLPILAVLLLVAATLRFLGLGESSLWMDEVVMVQEAAAGKYSIISQKTHRFHLELVEFFIGIFGANALGLRFWSALSGSLAVPLLGLWGWLIGGRLLGTVLGAMMAMNVFLLMYAQDGNYYAGMLLLFALQLVGFALAFRGCPHTGVLLVVAAALPAYWNHPVSLLPSGAVLGLLLAALVLVPSIRREVIRFHPLDWLRRPALPLAIALAVGAAIFATPRIKSAMKFADQLIDPGATRLKNVEPSLRYILDHFDHFVVNFFRPEPWQQGLVYPLIFLLLVGLTYIFIEAVKHRDGARFFLGVLLLSLPAASYIVLFSLTTERHFYIRYFTYLVPVYTMAIVYPLVIAAAKFPRPVPQLGKVACVLLLLMNAFFLIHYHGTGLANYTQGTRLLAAESPAPIEIMVPSRNDLVQARYFLRQNKLADTAPSLNYLNLSEAWDLFGGALPVSLYPTKSLHVLSAWREYETPRTNTFLRDGLTDVYTGTDKWGPERDLQVRRWDHTGRLILPGLAFRIREGETLPFLIAGAGKWTNGAATLDFEGITEWTPPPGPAVYTPVQDEVVDLSIWNIANAPVHRYLFTFQREDRTWLRSERDDSFDFLVYQDKDSSRIPVLKVRPRDHGDPLLKKNGSSIPQGHWIAVAVNGKHAGFWKVDFGVDIMRNIPLDLTLPPGNHRLSIHGLMPRNVYTPYLPWSFSGMEWRRPSQGEILVKSMENVGQTMVSQGWTELPTTGWQSPGSAKLVADESVRGPAGDVPQRLDIPGDAKDGVVVAGPPMPVVSGTVAVYTFCYRMKGLERLEMTPTVQFADAKGGSIGGGPVNGPNHRGSTIGDAWVRRQVVVPVPEGAVALLPVFQFFPVKPVLPSEKATVWFASLGSPGTSEAPGDPALDDRYFWSDAD